MNRYYFHNQINNFLQIIILGSSRAPIFHLYIQF